MAMTLYTKAQVLRLLHGWGYAEGSLPQRHRPETIVSVTPELRLNPDLTRAKVTFEGVNGARQRLYGVEFIH